MYEDSSHRCSRSVPCAAAFWPRCPIGRWPPPRIAKPANPSPPDHALTQALEKGDKSAVGALLDAKCQWVDVTGTVRNKAEALENLAAFAASDAGSPTELVTRDYGQVEVPRGIHSNVKFGHIWVKSAADWRAFVYVDTPIREVPERAFTPRKPTNADSCDNPCNTNAFQRR